MAGSDIGHSSHLRHFPHEQHSCQQDAGGNGNHHIQRHGQAETGQEHQNVAAGCGFQQMHRFGGFAHIPGHHHQQGRHGGHGQVGQNTGQRHQRQQHDQGMDHRRHGGFGPGPVVGGRPCDSRRRRDTAKERHHQIADALPHQFAVGAVALARHAIQHHGTQQ